MVTCPYIAAVLTGSMSLGDSPMTTQLATGRGRTGTQGFGLGNKAMVCYMLSSFRIAVLVSARMFSPFLNFDRLGDQLGN